jgi:disulfide bond formation protein DsbB
MAKQKDSGFFTYRKLHFIGLILSGSSVAVAAISLTAELGDIQCAACTAIRFFLLCLTFIFFIGFIVNPWKFGQRLLGFSSAILATAGLIFTGRYLWLSPNDPSVTDSCSLQLDSWLGLLPQDSGLATFFTKQNECLSSATNSLGLSLPQLTLLLFILLCAISWRILLRSPRQRVSLF